MRLLCLWLMMMKYLIALLCIKMFHEIETERERERGGLETNP